MSGSQALLTRIIKDVLSHYQNMSKTFDGVKEKTQTLHPARPGTKSVTHYAAC